MNSPAGAISRETAAVALVARPAGESRLHVLGAQDEVAPTVDARRDLLGLTREKLTELLAQDLGWPKFRALQLFQWIHRHRIKDFTECSNLSPRFREELQARYRVVDAPVITRQISRDGTRKYLFQLEGEARVESVMIKQPTRMTLCVSSQYGCGMGCAFCRTATMGFLRHLSPAEIVRQVRGVLIDAENFGDTFQNIVFMGMGEPLHNVDGVIDAIKILIDEHGYGLGPRKITVSTSGLVPGIKKLAAANLGVNLAISLNATNDETRTKIMPVNKGFNLEKLIGALREFPLTGRKLITWEYVLLEGVNTTDEDLKRLPKLIDGIPGKVNLIPYNENAGLGFKAPTPATIDKWHRTLNAKGFNATIRWSKGQDIDAACGQLATAKN